MTDRKFNKLFLKKVFNLVDIPFIRSLKSVGDDVYTYVYETVSESSGIECIEFMIDINEQTNIDETYRH